MKDPLPCCLSPVRCGLSGKGLDLPALEVQIKPPPYSLLYSRATQVQFSESTDRWRVPHRKTSRESSRAPRTLLSALTTRLGSLSKESG